VSAADQRCHKLTDQAERPHIPNDLELLHHRPRAVQRVFAQFLCAVWQVLIEQCPQGGEPRRAGQQPEFWPIRLREILPS
jgi:hypothetical protein